MEHINLNFENDEHIFNAFHAVFALDTGDIVISADLWDHEKDYGVEAAEKRPTGKQLSVSISDNYKYSDYLDPQDIGDGFSLKKLRNKNQDEWEKEDFKIAKVIVECYLEFILTDSNTFYQSKKIEKNGIKKEFGLLKGCPGDKIRSGGKGRGAGVGEGKGPIGRQGGIDRKGKGPVTKEDEKESEEKEKKLKKKPIKKSGDNDMELKDLIKALVDKGQTKEEIKKTIAQEYFKAKTIFKAEDIIKGNGEPFVMSNAFDNAVGEEIKKSQEAERVEEPVMGALPEWGNIKPTEYDYNKKEDITIEQKENASHIADASGMNVKVVAEEK